MDTYILGIMQQLSPQERVMFQTQFEVVRKDAVVAILLAFFLGSFGAHHFYLGRNGLGVLYLLFCWTFIPHIIALFECFFLPGRVRRWNEQKAYEIAQHIQSLRATVVR
jgi:TM2 domain-containing membrane protein YozV